MRWRISVFTIHVGYVREGEAPFQVLSPRQGRKFLHKCQLTSVDPKNVVHTPDLAPPRSRATEFSQTSRLQNLNPWGLSLKRYDAQQIPPSELRVMLDFPKFWNKFVGALLFHVSPRCTIVLLYENEESPSLQAMCFTFFGAKHLSRC